MAYNHNRKPSAIEMLKRPLRVPAAAPAPAKVEDKDAIIERLSESIDRLSRVDLRIPEFELTVTEREPGGGGIKTVIAKPKP